MQAAQIAELIRLLGLPVCLNCREIVARRGKSVWRVDCSDVSFAVRVFRPGEDKSARHERQMMMVAREAGFPVGAVHYAGTITNCPVLVVDWCSGRPLGDEIRARPWAARELGERFGEQQARMHDVGSGTPVPLDGWINFFGDVDPALRGALEKAAESAMLIHLDYHPANVVSDSSGISAILDWTNASFGEPRADLARTWLSMRQIFRPRRRNPALRFAHDLFAAGWWRGYTRLAGPQSQMAIFRTWAVEGYLREKLSQPSVTRRDLMSLVRLSHKLRREAELPQLSVEELLRRP